MGFNSCIQFDYHENSCRYSKGRRIVGLIDELMIKGWDIGIKEHIHLLDKGNNFDFLVFQKTLSNYVEIVELIEYKEMNNEPVLADLVHPNFGGIQVFFFFESANTIKVDLHDEDMELKLTEPIKSINKYLALIYKPR